MIENVISIGIMIVIFYLTLSSIIKFSNLDVNGLEDFTNEFNIGLIEDLKIIPSLDCPANYTSMFADYYYPGHAKGCQCHSGQEFSYSKCSFDKGCYQFDQVPQKKMNLWKGYNFCIKRSTVPYKDLVLAANDTMCPPKYRSCGRMDSLNNVLCYLTPKFCPVSDIQFLNSTAAGALNVTIDFRFNYLYQLNDKSYVFFTKNGTANTTNSIYSFFSLGLNSPCLYSDRYHSSNYLFPLQRNLSVYGCNSDTQFNLRDSEDTVDTRYATLDQYSIQSFFKDNNLYDLINRVNDIKANLSLKSVYLKGRSFSGWKASCISEQFSIQSEQETELFVSRMLFYNIIHSCVIIIILLVISISSCFFLEHFEYLFKLLSIAFCIINILYPIQMISKSNFVIDSLSDENGSCSDDKANNILNNIINACSDLQSSYSTILILDILYCVFIIYSLYKWIKPYNQKLQDQYKQILNNRR